MPYRTPPEIIAEADTCGLRRVLVVTALPMEMAAVRAHVATTATANGETNLYECGTFSASNGEWLVVVAQCGAGNHLAHAVVAAAKAEFGAFELILFSGIAGSRKADVPIGSVVAASQVYNPYSGKYGEDGFSSRPHTISADPRLVQIAEKVKRDAAWHVRFRPLLGGEPLPEPKDCPPPFPPASFVAPIASVEAVVANSTNELARQIAEHGGDAHAVEMEGYGAAMAAQTARIPALIVRGISDMLEGKTPDVDKLHQPLAAMFAAAFAFQVLDEWSLTQTSPIAPTSRPARRAGRRKPVKPAATKVKAQKAAIAKPSSVAHAAADPVPSAVPPARTSIVLNFEGDADDFPDDRLAAIAATVERIVKTKVRVLKGEAGSFRLFLELTGAMMQPPVAALRQTLADEHGAELLGAVTLSEYELICRLAGEMEAPSQPLLNWPANLPDGRHIDRPELAQLKAVLREQEDSATVVLGLPGSGKSALLATLAQQASANGWPVLAIKADLLPTGVDTEEKLQAHLGLSTTPSRLIERIATFRPVLLVIDQLDALAKYLDLHTGRLTVLLNLVRRLARTRNVHIVLSARTFEAQHDVRLLTINAETLNLDLPPWEAAQAVLDAHGVATEGWPDDAKDVLRSPQALATFLRLKERGGEPFDTYQTMLDRMWRERILAHPRSAELVQLVTDIAHHMAEAEHLWLAEARYDAHADDIDTLIALEILTRADTRASIGFTHQTLFDHALARSFARAPGRLSQYVVERQESLFIRPKLWAALTYLRGVETPAYETELDAIWNAQGLRMHLRLLLLDFLGQQAEPTDREALLMAWALDQPKLRAAAFRAIGGSPGWFERLADSVVAPAMTGDEESAGLAANVLAAAWPFARERVVDLLSGRWGERPERDLLTWNVLARCEAWNEAMIALAVTIIQRTNISPWAVDYAIGAIGIDDPAGAMKLVRAQLDRELEEARRVSAEREGLTPPEAQDERFAWGIANSPETPLRNLVEQSREWETVATIAASAPAATIAALWPWLLEVVQSMRRLEGPRHGLLGFGLSHSFDFRFEGEHSLQLPEPSLLASLRIAAEELARFDPPAFEAWVRENAGVDAEVVHRLFAHAMATDPERYAAFALDFLVSDPRRLWLGSIEDQFSTAKRLVQATSPYWSKEELDSFVAWLNAYAPTRPPHLSSARSRLNFIRLIRRLKVDFLTSLPQDRLPATVRRHVSEERRAVGSERIGATFTGVSAIGSPMSRDAIRKADDDDILNAFEELPDDTEWDHPRRRMMGGNIQLSREFAEFAKAEPERAAALIRRFRRGVGERAAGYALDAMAADADPDLVVELFLELETRGFTGEEYRASAARALGQLVGRKETLGDEVIDVLRSWLAPYIPPTQQGGDEAEDEPTTPDPLSDDETKSDDERMTSVLWGYGGFAILPHGNYPVLESITRALLGRGEHDRLVDILAEHLERDENPDVWRAMLQYFVYLQPADETRRASLLSALFARYPALLGTMEATYVLAHAHWWVPELVRDLLAGWPTDTRQSQIVYGELVGLIAIVQPALTWPRPLLNAVVDDPGRSTERIGATNSAVNLWIGLEHRSAATDLLLRLIPRADKAVWGALFDVFRLVSELTPEPDTVRLLGAIADHVGRAGRIEPSFVVERLQSLLPHQATVVARIAEGLIEHWKDELGDIRTSTAMASSELINLAVTLHRLGAETREAGTRMLETLLLTEAYAAQQTLDELDARFRSSRAPVRRRLPRRTARRGRSRRAGTS